MTRRRIVTAAAVLLLIGAAFGVLASGVLPYRLFIVHTGSMSPTFASTSAVIVHTGEYRVGEPVSFTENGDIVTHRLISIAEDGSIVTKGDANATPDPWKLTTKDILGGVVSDIPHLGYWLQFLKNPIGLLTILMAAIVCWQLWTFGDTKSTTGTMTPEPRFKHRASTPRHARAAG